MPSPRQSSPVARFARRIRHRFERLETRDLCAIDAQEQLFVYLLNRARHDPQAYAAQTNLPISLAGVAASPPAAVNDKLFASAGFHAEEMATFNYAAHQSAVTGDWPNKMVLDQGYVLPNYFPINSNQVESLAAGTLYTTADVPLEDLIIDAGINPPGHRIHLLAMDAFNADNREIGVGFASNNAATYTNYWTVHLTRTDPADTFLTGVVYNDLNHNNLYDAGEGLSGINVVAGALNTTTNSQGGWSLKVNQNTTYTIVVSGGAFQGTTRLVADVGTSNREADFISGNRLAQLDFAAPPNQPPFAADDAASTANTVAVSINVLANDVDPEAALNSASLAITQQPQHGTASIDTLTHKILYTPSGGYVGGDSFQYTVQDTPGLSSNTASVTITVTAPLVFPWHSPTDPDDVDDSHSISNNDVFVIALELKKNGAHSLSVPVDGNAPPPYYDVVADGVLNNADAFHVIARAKAQQAGGEGESVLTANSVAATDQIFFETESKPALAQMLVSPVWAWDPNLDHFDWRKRAAR